MCSLSGYNQGWSYKWNALRMMIVLLNYCSTLTFYLNFQILIYIFFLKQINSVESSHENIHVYLVMIDIFIFVFYKKYPEKRRDR